MRPVLLPPALMVVMGAVAMAQAPTPTPKSPDAAWEGTWSLVAEESDKVEDLIESHLHDVNFMTRFFWRRKLRQVCKAYPGLDILVGQAFFSVVLGRKLPMDTPTNGTLGEWKRSDGETLKVSMKRADPSMIQILRGDGYALTFAYTLSAEGLLNLHATYNNPKLSKPISYKLVYRRKE